MRIRQLASKNNFGLAWRRITTGGNVQYKHFYRSLYYAYEVALDKNLADLRPRIFNLMFYIPTFQRPSASLFIGARAR